MQLSTPPRSARRVAGGAWDAAAEDEAVGRERLGVAGPRAEVEGRSLRLGAEGPAAVLGAAAGGSADEDADAEGSGADEDAAGGGGSRWGWFESGWGCCCASGLGWLSESVWRGL